MTARLIGHLSSGECVPLDAIRLTMSSDAVRIDGFLKVLRIVGASAKHMVVQYLSFDDVVGHLSSHAEDGIYIRFAIESFSGSKCRMKISCNQTVSEVIICMFKFAPVTYYSETPAHGPFMMMSDIAVGYPLTWNLWRFGDRSIMCDKLILQVDGDEPDEKITLISVSKLPEKNRCITQFTVVAVIVDKQFYIILNDDPSCVVPVQERVVPAVYGYKGPSKTLDT